MEPRTYNITLRSPVGGGKEKHVVDDSKIARFLLGNHDKLVSGCPVLQTLCMLSQPEDDIDLISLRIAQLKEERLSMVPASERYRAVDLLIAGLRVRIAHNKVLSNMAMNISRSHLKDPAVRAFLIDYDKSPTGNISAAFESYLNQRIEKSLQDINH